MKDNLHPKNILNRFLSETPEYWKKVRNTMIVIGAVSAAIIAAPIALPPVIVTVATYGLTIGAVGAALSQTAKK